MIRTQGITLMVGITIWMLCIRKWRQAIGFVTGFAITTLPWTFRNHLAGLGPNRYLDQLLAVNIWQPDAGRVSFGELIERGFNTLQMLVTKAIPNTVTPYLNVDYEATATFGEWMTGLILITIILFGYWRLKRYFGFFTVYSAAVIGIICLWSAPSGNRYITTLVPLLEIGLVIGVYTLIEIGLRSRFNIRHVFSPLWLLIPALLLASGHIRSVAAEVRRPLPPQLSGFIDAARTVQKDYRLKRLYVAANPPYSMSMPDVMFAISNTQQMTNSSSVDSSTLKPITCCSISWAMLLHGNISILQSKNIKSCSVSLRHFVFHKLFCCILIVRPLNSNSNRNDCPIIH